ncbi:glutamine--fructose-6-phosphate transaminase (isomerizing) [Pseudonocardia hispaniensis]|uniref:Glutamine--fructose-6-phosphate aminotransferase [isomerizing] n=1 Tax=Pseudonocardia hispaniensis TaxID=904933 RepID=A0ABW1J2H2_9PSEU
MCGIVAYCGAPPAVPRLLSGLKRLEYRGYDSVGVGLLHRPDDRLCVHRAAGRLTDLVAALPNSGLEAVTTGIGHTRWATHGQPTAANAHPHQDCTQMIAVVHNGTIDNADEVTDWLDARGHKIATEVDTELIAHLIEEHLLEACDPLRASPVTTTEGPADRVAGPAALERLVAAVAGAVEHLRGSWALAVAMDGVPGIVLARHRSPLLLGVTRTALMAASDALGLGPHVEDVRELRDGDVVALAPNRQVSWYDRGGRAVAPPDPLRLSVRHVDAELGGALDYTSKEIAGQPAAAARILDTVAGRLVGGRLLDDLGLPSTLPVHLLACGSSAYAAAVTARLLTQFAGLRTRVMTASERIASPSDGDVLTVAFSQSGETADVLACLQDGRRGPWLAITNNPGSTLARRCDAVFDIQCGPELAVAATKSFTTQVLAGAALALALSTSRSRRDILAWERVLLAVPDRLAATDALAAPIAAELASTFAGQPGWIFISRGAGVPYAQEGALKLKELAYRWTEALPAGELKHGPIALVTSGVPVVAVTAMPTQRLAVNLREVAARGAQVITVGGRIPDAVLPAVLPAREPPWGPLESVVALQHLAREVAVELGHDVDRPRNLAKSVTVE